jgi:hypothetical protein
MSSKLDNWRLCVAIIKGRVEFLGRSEIEVSAEIIARGSFLRVSITKTETCIWDWVSLCNVRRCEVAVHVHGCC